jgi:transcriptional regulator with XRE-family HTH domain
MIELKTIRLLRGFTQEYLAQLTNITQEEICRYEKGLVIPNFKNMAKIAEALSCGIDTIWRD